MTVVMLVIALGVLAMSMLQPMMPLYLTSIGAEPETVGLMLSVAMIGMVIGEFSWGWVADKRGARLPMAVGNIFSGFFVLCFIGTGNHLLLYFIFFLWGIFRSALFSSGRGYIGINSPAAKKATFMALMALMISASKSIGALPSGFLADKLGIYFVFIVSAGISLTAGVVSIIFLSRTGPVERYSSAVDLHLPGEIKNYGEKTELTSFFFQCLITALQFLGIGVLTSFLPLFATRVVGVSLPRVGVLFTLYGIASMVMSIPMGVLADRLGKKVLTVIGLFVSSTAMIGIAYSTSYLWLILSVLWAGIGLATFSPAALGIISDLVPEKRQGTAMGFYGAFGENVGIVAGASLGGLLWGAYGPRLTFLTAAVAAAVGILISILLVKRGSTSSKK